MDYAQTDFPSRISARAVTAGVLMVFALMALFMSLAAAFNLWTYSFAEYASQNAGNLWTWTFVAWIISVFFGSYVAAVASRSSGSRDGYLHGATVWAASTVFGCTFLAFAIGSFGTLSYAPWGAFIGNVLALVAGFFGGVSGIRLGKRSEEPKRHGAEKHRPEHAFGT